jgi:hypothetical protein
LFTAADRNRLAPVEDFQRPENAKLDHRRFLSGPRVRTPMADEFLRSLS